MSLDVVCDMESSVDTLSATELLSLESARAEVESVGTALGLPPASVLLSDTCPDLGLPSVSDLVTDGFGKPSTSHSFTVEASFDTIIFQVLKVGLGYFDDTDLTSLTASHPRIGYLHTSMKRYAQIDFRPLRQYDLNYASQKEIPQDRIDMFMACLFHFDLSVANVMRYVGNNYTGSYRDVEKAVEKMQELGVDDDLITMYVRVMVLGAPAHMVAESTHENAVLHRRMGNHPSVDQNIELVQKAMNKLEKNQFVMPFEQWIAPFVPHLFFSPTHVTMRPGKDPRFIFDASRRFTATSVPVNRMTSTPLGVELDCAYGDVLQRVLIRVWNLRITYPFLDIILHANDVKSCFRQLKHHPDVAGAFSYIIADLLYISCGLTFGSDFSPSTWEVPRRIIEQMSESLFSDNSLVSKHRDKLDQLVWSKQLGKSKTFVNAHPSATHKGVLDAEGKPVNTPHSMFVDDDLYADVFDVDRMERAIAAGVESIYILLGVSNLVVRQDPISWDKFLDMIIHYRTKILGLTIDTRLMTVGISPDYLEKVNKLLNTTWKNRKSFKVKEAEMLVGQLVHISGLALWLKHIMGHLITSLAAAIGSNKHTLVSTCKKFRDLMKVSQEEENESKRTFAQSMTAKKVHNFHKLHFILPTMHEEMNIIKWALACDEIKKSSPIAHLIPNNDDAECHGDASLDSAGGWSIDMKFFWWIDWPEDVKKRTLRYIKNGKTNELICINCLEYATVLINFAACMYFWLTEGNAKARNIPYPRVMIKADNKSSEYWATKGCKRSMVGRRLGRLQFAMMIDNPVGLDTGHVDTKTNYIADYISRIKRESDVLVGFDSLMQKYPQLNACRRFHPSKELISYVTDALLSRKLIDPSDLVQLLRRNPGKIAS